MQLPKAYCSMTAVLLALCGAVAQDYGTPGDYLIELYPDARSQAMGGGSVALTDGTDAIFVNPGALDRLSYVELSCYYLRIMQAFHFYNVPFAYPFGRFGTLGVGLTGIISDEAPRYNAFGIQTAGTYRLYDNTFTLCYSKTLGSLAGVGANIKLANKQIETESGVGVGLDIGGVITPLPWLTFGMVLENLGGPTIKLVSVPESYTSALKAGAGVKLLDEKLLINCNFYLLDLFTDASQYAPGTRKEYPKRWSFGTEYWLFPFLALRGGVNDRMAGGGLGFRVRNLEPDIAVSYSTDPTDLNPGFTYGFSLCSQFGKPIPKMEAELETKTREVAQRADLQKGQDLFIRGYPRDARPLIAGYVKDHPEDKNAGELLKEIEARCAGGEIKDILDEARKEMDNKNFARAEELVGKALGLVPNDPDANALKGKLSLHKENDKRLKNVGSLYAQKRYDEMAKELEIVLSLDSDNVEARQYKGKIADFIKKYEADKHYNLAFKLYYENKDVEKANSELQKTFDLVPDHHEAHALYDKISKEIKEMYLKKVGQMVDAKGLKVDNADLKKLIAVDIQDKLINVRSMLDAKQFDQALTQLEAILRDKPDDAQALKLKQAALDGQKTQKSDALYEEALRLFNDGKLSESEKKAGEALALYTGNDKAKGLLSDIKQKEWKENLDKAQARIASGKPADLDSAERLVDNFLSVNKDDERGVSLRLSIRTERLVAEANQEIEKGNYDKADQTLQKALKMNPDSKKVKDAFKSLKDAMDALQ